MSIRMFLVDDDDYVTRLPLRLYDRLSSGDATAAIPALSGKKARYALAIVDTEGRRVMQVQALECGYLPFDSTGRLDRRALDEQGELAMAMLGPLVLAETPSSVTNAAHLFARRAFKHRYKWEPSDVVIQRISELLFSPRGAPNQ